MSNSSSSSSSQSSPSSVPPGDGSATSSATFCSAENCDGDKFCFNPRCSHCIGSDPPSCSNYRSLLGFDSIPLKDSEKLWRVITASAKGFAVGAGLRGGLSSFAVLAKLLRSRSSRFSRKVELFTNSEAIAISLKETLRYGLFLGTFAGTFVSVDEIIASFGGHRRTRKWRALLAGLIAGPSMLLTGLHMQHTGMALYILMRAVVLASRCVVKSKRFGKYCKPLTWRHGDIFLMCLASSQNLSAYILKPESLVPSYLSFCMKQGAKDPVILQGVKEIASGLPFTNLDLIEKYYSSIGVDVKLDPRMQIPCSILHGNASCSSHFMSFFVESYKRALSIYLPVYFIPALAVHHRGLFNRPSSILGRVLLSIARSSLFLSTYSSSAWLWMCVFSRIFRRSNIPTVTMGMFLSASALAIEKKSRRMEIALFCLARAIESFFKCMADAGYLPKSKNLKRADVVVFSISTAIIMHCYAQERDVFRSKYLNVLDWVFGVPPPSDETPQKKD